MFCKTLIVLGSHPQLELITKLYSNFQHAREARVFSCNWSNNHLTAHALNIAEFHSILAVARLKRAPVICWRKWRSSGWS